jgi:thiol:disulfide interchange protein DsbD
MTKCTKFAMLMLFIASMLVPHCAITQASDPENMQPQAATTHQTPEPDTRINVIDMLKQATQSENSNIFYALILAFLAGVLVSFTPCIYPMIPITVGILQAQATQSMAYNFFSALSYVLGISVVYASLGYLSASTSIIFGRWLASPWFILFIIIFFLYLAFAMFGFYELYMPSFLTRSRDLSVKHSLTHSFLFGAISGTVASPCLTPALAILLAIAAKTGNPVLGFLYLFFFSLGMGTLLLLIGTFSGALHLLPRSGEWMEEIKKSFGFMMLAVCIYFLSPLLNKEVVLELYSLVLLVSSVYYFCTARQNRIKLLLGLFLFLASITTLAFAIKNSITPGV